jgi:hypothetical protein
MKRLSVVLVALLLFGAACKDEQPPAAPSGPQMTFTFSATLSPANENPPIAGPEATGSGTATITMNVTRDAAGAITGGTINFQVSLTGFPSTTAITIAHIHTGAPGTNGGIAVNTGLTAGEVTLTGGAGSFTKNNVVIPSVTLANEFIVNPNGYYFNVHSSANPGGVVRGPLVRTN